MPYEPLLIVFIEVAVAIAGFSGLVAALISQGAVPWGVNDRANFRFLLAGSGVVALFSALPIVIVGSGVDEANAWQVSSFTFTFVAFVRGVAIAIEQRNNLGARNILILFVTFSLIGLMAIGGYYQLAWTYVLFLMYFLGLALFYFGNFVMRMANVTERDV